MSRLRELSHTIFECKYHIEFCPKYRFRIFREDIREYTRQQIYSLCRQKDLVEVLELNVQADHTHMVLSIPPKFSASSFMGFLKGKVSLRLFSRYGQLGQALLGSPSLEPWLLCQHRGFRRREDSQIREIPGAQGS